jgi:hypothetical protein
MKEEIYLLNPYYITRGKSAENSMGILENFHFQLRFPKTSLPLTHSETLQPLTSIPESPFD